MRLTQCEAPTREIRLDHNTGTTCPTLCDKYVGSSTSPTNHVTLKMQETGRTVYSLYPRRLERLTICKSNYKAGPRLEPSTSRTAVWRSTN